jgi:serine/threonine-protein kinase PpkA
MSLQIPGYKIVRPVAEGGMASVYLAVQESLRRNVALKLLKKFDNTAQSNRFHNEGRIIASLNHRNIITLHDIGVIGEQHYISMEYLEGGDLEERIRKGMSTDASLDVVEAIGSCLDFVHRKDIIHRDIKPANILFHKDGTPILTDFGIAKQLVVDTRLTMDGTALGSPYYLSPEQAECKPLDGRTDIYGLGIILYEMLTGIKPYQGSSHIETIIAHLANPLPSLPPELSCFQSLLDRMIAKQRDERFASAGEMVETLRELRQYRPQGIAIPKLSGLIRNLHTSSTMFQAKSTTAGFVPRLNKSESQQYMLESAVNSTRIVLRKISEFLPDDRIRGVTAGVAAVLLIVALGFLVTKPAQTVATEQTVNGVPADGTTQATTLDSGDEPVQQAALDSGDEPVQQYEEYLRQAKQAIDEYRLTTPESNNAYYYYQMILEEDPDHEEALTGVAEITETYTRLAEQELDRFHYNKAKVYLHRGLALDPDNEQLLELERTNAFADVSRRTIGGIKSLFQ